MKTLVFVFIISIISSGCGSVEPTSVIDGNYEGVYSITHNYVTDSAYTLQGPVSFTFSKGKYKCMPEKLWTPPSGSGIYRVGRQKITLINKSGHTTDFDPSLILDGDFNYSFNGERLFLTQENKSLNRFHSINIYRLTGK